MTPSNGNSGGDSGADSFGDSAGHLLELPLSVLTPRRSDGTGPRRYGRAQNRNYSEPVVGSNNNVSSNNSPSNSSAGELNSTAQNDAPVESNHLIVLAYISFTILFQILLLVPGISVFRTPLRMFPFAASLALIFFPPRRVVRGSRMHPALPPAIVVLVITLFGLLNQETEGMLSGVATVVFYASILAPLVWVGRLQLSERGFTMIVLLLWSFYTLSSTVGVLQVMYPGHFRGAISTLVQEQQDINLVGSKINLANGTVTERPFGLTDIPGGVAGSGVAAFVFGLGLLSVTRGTRLTILYAAGMATGLFVIYLTQVRVALVSCGIAATGYVVLLAWRGQTKMLTQVLISLGVIITVSTIAALVVGGADTADRILSLIQDDPGKVYYGNRGVFLESTFYYWLPRFPVGTGLGRYGMMATYFAADHGLGTRSLWAEIQWTAWAFDGGWLMIIAYPTAILLAVVVTIRIALNQSAGSLSVWGTIFTAYNISSVAITFSYCLFMSQSGLEFWMLNAAIFATYRTYRKESTSAVPVGFEELPQVWRPTVSAAGAVTPAATRSSGKRAALSGHAISGAGSRQRPAVRAVIQANDDVADSGAPQ